MRDRVAVDVRQAVLAVGRGAGGARSPALRCEALSQMVTMMTMRITTRPATPYTAGEWLSLRQARIVAMSRIQTMDSGMRIFQPSAHQLVVPGAVCSVPRSQT